MNTAAILAAVSLALVAGCAVEPEPSTGEPGLRPSYKPSLDPRLPDEVGGSEIRTEPDHPNINETLEIGTPEADNDRLLDDGRVMWVEVIVIDDSRVDYLHRYDPGTGIDTIEILDEDGHAR